MSTKTITTVRSDGVGYLPGDRLTISWFVPDTRLWRRLWFFLTRQGKPYRVVQKSVAATGVSSTSISVRDV